MKRKTLCLGILFVLIFLVAPIGQVKAVELHIGVEVHSWLRGSNTTWELTEPAAEVTNVPDIFDETKGLQRNMALSEGTALTISATIENHLASQRVIETGYVIRYRLPDGDWSSLSTDTATYTILGFETRAAATDTEDHTNYGWFVEGTEFHLAIWFKEYPQSNPADVVYKGYVWWFTLVADSTPDSGDDSSEDGTTDNGSTGTTDDEEGQTWWERFFDLIAELFDFIAQKLQELYESLSNGG